MAAQAVLLTANLRLRTSATTHKLRYSIRKNFTRFVKLIPLGEAELKRRQIKHRGMLACLAVENAWMGLRRLDARIPPVVVVLGRSMGTHGHFAPSFWRYQQDKNAHELFISPALFASPDAVLATLMHEACHALLWPDQRGGTGSTCYYHTKIFRDTCREFGLACEFCNTRYGWTNTAWPATGVPHRYSTILQGLERDLPLGTAESARVSLVTKKELPRPGHLVLRCHCRVPRRIYVSRQSALAGGICCDICSARFEPETR
jgi:hypothetical protein